MTSWPPGPPPGGTPGTGPAGSGTDQGHLDAAVLVELTEGALPAPVATAAAEHVAACRHCQAHQADLAATAERVRALLGALPRPELPADVQARLAAGLAAERSAQPTPGSTAPGAAGSAPSGSPLAGSLTSRFRGSGRPGPGRAHPTGAGRRTPWASTRTLGGLAAAAAVLAVAALVVPPLIEGGGPDSAEQAASGGTALEEAAPGGDGVPPPDASGTAYTAGVLAPAARALVAAAQAEAGDGKGSEGAGGASPEVFGPRAVDTGEPRQVVPPPLTRLSRPGPLADCVRALAAGRSVVPLAVDLATYEGRPAAVVVLSTEGNPASLDVFVVGPGCSALDEQLLRFARISRAG